MGTVNYVGDRGRPGAPQDMSPIEIDVEIARLLYEVKDPTAKRQILELIRAFLRGEQ